MGLRAPPPQPPGAIFFSPYPKRKRGGACTSRGGGRSRATKRPAPDCSTNGFVHSGGCLCAQCACSVRAVQSICTAANTGPRLPCPVQRLGLQPLVSPTQPCFGKCPHLPVATYTGPCRAPVASTRPAGAASLHFPLAHPRLVPPPPRGTCFCPPKRRALECKPFQLGLM